MSQLPGGRIGIGLAAYESIQHSFRALIFRLLTKGAFFLYSLTSFSSLKCRLPSPALVGSRYVVEPH